MIPLFQELKITIKFWRLLLFTIATSFCSYAQERSEADIDVLLDDLFFSEQQFVDELVESDKSYQFLYSSVAYSNNTYFSGRDAGVDQFSIIPQISYYHSSGFHASVSGVYYERFSPSWDFTSVSLGYFNSFGKDKSFTYNAAYTRYLYSDGYDAFTNSLEASIGLRNKKRTLGTSLILSYLFGTDSSYQLVSSSYVNINLFRKAAQAFRIRPTLNIIAAKQDFTFSKVLMVAGKRQIRTYMFETFDVLNTQLAIPLSYAVNSWDFELSYTLNFPNPIANQGALPNTSFFAFYVGYLLDFSK
jgi:hypothetical protein